MKIFFVLVLLTFQQSAWAFPGPLMQTQAIEQLNDICADAWCESSVDFVFKKMQCTFENGNCLLEFTTQENFSPNQPLENGHCLMTEIQSNEQLFELISTVPSGTQLPLLRSSFLEQVNRCLMDYMK